MLLPKKILFYLLKFLKLHNFKFDTEYGKVFLDFENKGISQRLFYYKTRESDKVDLIKNILLPGDGVIDCGSNIGVYPYMEAKLVGKCGFVACVEPDPRNIKTLKKNFDLIDSKKIMKEKALGKVNANIDLNLYEQTNITRFAKIENHFKKEAPSEKINFHQVEMIDFEKLLDSIEFDFSKIKLFRMDVEGAEVDILESISKKLDLVPNMKILFETHPDFYSKDKLIEILKPFINKGYKFEKLISSGSFNVDHAKKYNLKISKKIYSDGFKRYLFENVNNELSIELINYKKPKLIRYVLLGK